MTMTPKEKAELSTWCRQASEAELRDAITRLRAGRQDCVVVAKQELIARGLATTTPGEPK